MLAISELVRPVVPAGLVPSQVVIRRPKFAVRLHGVLRPDRRGRRAAFSPGRLAIGREAGGLVRVGEV